MEFKSVNKIIENSFRENWDRPALSNYQGVTLSYRDVARRIAKLHIAFEQCGLQKGDKVAICSRNQANWGVSFLAALTYGAVPVPLLHEFKPGNIHYLVNHSDAKVLWIEIHLWSFPPAVLSVLWSQAMCLCFPELLRPVYPGSARLRMNGAWPIWAGKGYFKGDFKG